MDPSTVRTIACKMYNRGQAGDPESSTILSDSTDKSLGGGQMASDITELLLKLLHQNYLNNMCLLYYLY
jgi:microcystin degradation protein MlrC